MNNLLPIISSSGSDIGEFWDVLTTPSDDWQRIAISETGQYQIGSKYIAGENYVYVSSNFTNFPASYKIFIDDTQAPYFAVSNSGQYMVSAEYTGDLLRSRSGYLRLTTNFGSIWNFPFSDSTASGNIRTIKSWRGVAMSNSGEFMTGVTWNDKIFTSNNFGTSWTARDSARLWAGIAVSGDGSRQTALVSNGPIYISTDFGVTWTPQPGSPSRNWSAIAMSDSGQYQTAVADSSALVVSNDFGATWVERNAPRAWRDIAVSSTGQHQTALVYGGQIYVSNDFGVNWVPRATNRNWVSIGMSSDATYQIAVDYNNFLYESRQ